MLVIGDNRNRPSCHLLSYVERMHTRPPALWAAPYQQGAQGTPWLCESKGGTRYTLALQHLAPILKATLVPPRVGGCHVSDRGSLVAQFPAITHYPAIV